MKRKPRKAPLTGVLVVLWTASLVFAVYGGVGWLVSMWAISPPLAVLLAVAFAMAPLAASALTEAAIRGGGLAAWSAVLVFCAMDAAANVHAFWTFEETALHAENTRRLGEHAKAMQVYEGDRKVLTDTISAASAKLVAMPGAATVCEGAGPKTCTSRLAGQADETRRLTEARDDAQRKLDGLKAPQAPEKARMLPMEATALIHCLLSFALVAGFLGTHSARRKAEPVQHTAKRKPRRTPRAPKPAAPKEFPKLATVNGEQLSLF